MPEGTNEFTQALIDNRTGLSDELVEDAVREVFVEKGSIAGHLFATNTWQGDGTLMGRKRWAPPTSIREEIALARDMATRDSDVSAAIGEMVADAFGEGMENFHDDERTLAIYNGVAREAHLDSTLKELYREYLVSGQVTTASIFRRTTVDWTPEGGDGRSRRTFSVAYPMLKILRAERIVPLGGPLGGGDLAYDPYDQKPLREWLQELFDPKTTPARAGEMRREDPVSASLFVAPVQIPNGDDLLGVTRTVYQLNPRMVWRTTMPKGDEDHPHPLLTANLPMLEAKRLLILSDHALAQGAMNYIVVAKKGSDQRPATQAEVTNLQNVVAQASRSGVLVGDHRLDFDIITPKMEELLSGAKHRLVSRKITMGLMRVTEPVTSDPGGEGMRAELEKVARVVTADRLDIKRHVEQGPYEEVRRRNPDVRGGIAKLWFPKVILAGSQYFTDYVLKLRDRGDIPRKYAVEAAGFDYEAGLAQRRRELERGDDDTLVPGAVPFHKEGGPPADNTEGRPPGASPDNGRPGSRERDRESRNEAVVARLEENDEVVRIGEITSEILDQYPKAEVGRVTTTERSMVEIEETAESGMSIYVPVNPDYKVNELRAVRLANGFSMLVGRRSFDEAVVAKTLIFSRPAFDEVAAKENAMRWGFSNVG